MALRKPILCKRLIFFCAVVSAGAGAGALRGFALLAGAGVGGDLAADEGVSGMKVRKYAKMVSA
jgi:hypothetical protein